MKPDWDAGMMIATSMSRLDNHTTVKDGTAIIPEKELSLFHAWMSTALELLLKPQGERKR